MLESLVAIGIRPGFDEVLIKPANPSMPFDAIVSALGRNCASVESEMARTCIQSDLSRLRGARVPIDEDNDINQQIACELMRQAGLEAEVAHNGAVCLEKVANERYDLVFMDIQMPEMDGLTATRRLREDYRFKSLPIVGMTAHALAGDREKGIAAGMSDYVTKPLDPQVVLDDFSPRYAGAVDQIRSSIAIRDIAAAQCHAHMLKGVAGNLGMDELHTIVARVDAVLKAGDRSATSIDDLANALATMLERLRLGKAA